MLHVLLAPAQFVLNQLNYRLKFSLIGVVIGLPLVLSVYMLYCKNQESIDFAKKEQEGAILCQMFLEAMNDMYQHKSYTEAIRLGNTSFEATLKEREAEVDGDFKEEFLGKQKETLKQYKLLSQTEKVFQKWTALKTNWPNYSEEQNHAEHDKLLSEFTQLYLLTANNTNLILDPEVASYNFADVLVNKAPSTYAKVSEIRDLGVKSLSLGSTDPQDLSRRDLLDIQLDESIEQLSSSFNVIYEGNPEFKPKLNASLQKAKASITHYSHLFGTFNMEGQVNPDTIAYFNQGDKVLAEFQVVLDDCQKNLDQLLKKRIEGLQATNTLFLVVSVLTMIFLIYLFVAFYDVVIQAVTRIEGTTLRLADGDLTVHVDVTSKDEIGRIGTAFNQMAKGFLDLIKDVQSSTNEVASSSRTLTDTSTEMTETAQEMAAMASQASGLTEELNVNISTVAAAVEQSSASIRQVTESCANAESNIKRIGEVAESISSSMQTVSGATQSVTVSVNAVANATDTVSNSVNTVSAAMYQITTNANGLAKVSGDFDKSIRSAAKESTSMTHSIEQVANAMSDITSSVNTVASAVEEMTASLSEVARNTNTASSISDKAQKAVNTAETVITTLDNYAKEIGNVVEVIKTIAEQTDLLALNATIEAARAGEAGKGFAVVANEVKELAKQASSSTEVIRGQVQMIQNSTNSTIGTIKEISSVIAELNQINNTIAYAVEEQTQAADQIRASAENSAHSVAGVNANVQQVASSAGSVNQTIQKLSSDSAELSSSVQGIAQAATEVNSNVQEIVTSTQEVGQNIQSILNEVQNVTENIEGVTQTAIDIARQVGQASDNVQHIVRNMQEIDTGTNEIAKTSSSVAQNASEMAKSVHMVETSTQKTFEGSNYTKDSAGQLLNLASRLETVVSRFKTEAVSLN